ncbi:MAG: sorbosone dehydrogenase family protein, partial [Blastocatellia bacterium]|nr:sorbosone dehydrogenase family protein [Blastocatellia bacterium]
MNQRHIIRCGLSLSLLAACSIAAATFTGAFGRGVVNGQTKDGQATNDKKQQSEETEAPGVRHSLTPADLPPPYATGSAVNYPTLVPQPEGVMPQVLKGFRVEKFAFNLVNPRMIRTAPNGDIFVAESGANRIHVLRDADGDGIPEVSEVFAEGLNYPFGIAFYPVGDNPQYVY